MNTPSFTPLPEPPEKQDTRIPASEIPSHFNRTLRISQPNTAVFLNSDAAERYLKRTLAGAHFPENAERNLIVTFENAARGGVSRVLLALEGTPPQGMASLVVPTGIRWVGGHPGFSAWPYSDKNNLVCMSWQLWLYPSPNETPRLPRLETSPEVVAAAIETAANHRPLPGH